MHFAQQHSTLSYRIRECVHFAHATQSSRTETLAEQLKKRSTAKVPVEERLAFH